MNPKKYWICTHI